MEPCWLAARHFRMNSPTLPPSPNQQFTAPSKVRHGVVFLLFVLTALNYADRATLSIAGPDISSQFGLNKIQMGYILSAFGWSYAIAQLPGGWLLDRFGTKRVYFWSILLWSLFTLLQGFVGFLTAGLAMVSLFGLRFLMGAAEAPSFPGNSRIVAAWFPTTERGTASAVFNSAQYFATVIFAPIMAWITHQYGWPSVFWFMGGLGVMMAIIWLKVIRSPRDHPRVNAAELHHIESGGGLVDLEKVAVDASTGRNPVSWDSIRQLLSNRMLLGIYLGQYCITTLTFFFITWFPTYLIEQRGMSILKAGFMASLPALCGFFGGILGGTISDGMLKRGFSLTASRKTPIVIGMLTAVSMIICNYVQADWLVVALMALAFFGKGIGALGWAVVADTSPKEIAGLSAGLFNTFGNTAAITTPIVIGYILQWTGSFNGALMFVAANALGAIFCYLVLVGEIKRVELAPARTSLR